MAAIDVVPANEVSWQELKLVFGTRGEASSCQCQWFKIRDSEWASVPAEERAERLREQTGCGHPESMTSSGLVARVDGDPAGWCAIEPRTTYIRLVRSRVPWADRDEDKTDDGIWALTCFVTRTGFRRKGVSRKRDASARPNRHYAGWATLRRRASARAATTR